MVCEVIGSIPSETSSDNSYTKFPAIRRMSNVVWSEKTLRREISILKTEHVHFGSILACIDERIYVLQIDKYVYDDHNQQNSLSAAYRCGLKWGDEITVVNGVNVHQLDIHSIYKILNSSFEVNLTIIDTPEIRTVKIKKDQKYKHCNEAIGLCYKDGKIAHIAKNSPCELAGLKKETVVVFIGEHCVLETSGPKVKKCIEHEWKKKKEVTFSTATAKWALAMTRATEYVIERKFGKYSVPDMVESTYKE
eukprot:Awhi_evm1s13117